MLTRSLLLLFIFLIHILACVANSDDETRQGQRARISIKNNADQRLAQKQAQRKEARHIKREQERQKRFKERRTRHNHHQENHPLKSSYQHSFTPQASRIFSPKVVQGPTASPSGMGLQFFPISTPPSSTFSSSRQESENRMDASD